jgi:5-methylcytosine-specific restriction endonuclease McrA
MIFFKSLFKVKDSMDISDLGDNEIPKDGKNQKQSDQKFDLLSTQNIETKKFTEEETNEFIERFVKYYENFDGLDPMFEDAGRLIVMHQVASSSLMQRNMKIGYNRAVKLLKQLELTGIVKSNFNPNQLPNVTIKTEFEFRHFIQNDLCITNIQAFYDEHIVEIVRKIQSIHLEREDKRFQQEKKSIKQELLEIERKKTLRNEAYKELVSQGLISNQSIDREGRRELIPQDVMDSVWNRDGGRCTKCGSQENLEFDHIIPFSKGGANTYRNLQILCKKCNVEKSNKIG